MQRIWALMMLVVVLAGLALGYFAAPKYRAPAESGQGRLRARAAQFYRALRVADYGSAARLMTPARQYGDTKALEQQIKDTAQMQARLKSDTLAKLAESAESITPGGLDVQIDGNWAVTGGECLMPTDKEMVSAALEQLVWLWTDGDWWCYAFSNPELIAYGNPPDFARDVLLKNTKLGGRQAAFEQAQREAEAADAAAAQAEDAQAGAKPAPDAEAAPSAGAAAEGGGA